MPKPSAIIAAELRVALDRHLAAEGFSVKQRDFTIETVTDWTPTLGISNLYNGVDESMDSIISEVMRTEVVKLICADRAKASAETIIADDNADMSRLPRAERIARWRSAGNR